MDLQFTAIEFVQALFVISLLVIIACLEFEAHQASKVSNVDAVMRSVERGGWGEKEKRKRDAYTLIGTVAFMVAIVTGILSLGN